MDSFKVGDKVKIVKQPYDMGPYKPLIVGETAEIIWIDNAAHAPILLWFKGATWGHTGGGRAPRGEAYWVQPQTIAHLDDVSGYIVAQKAGASIYPAHRPVIHSDRTTAEKEALRLADQNHKDFVVLKMVSVAQSPKVPAATLKEII